jgi:hypothetical protein
VEGPPGEGMSSPLVKPEIGYEFVPPEGTTPKQVIMNALTASILKKLRENGTYEGPFVNDN